MTQVIFRLDAILEQLQMIAQGRLIPQPQPPPSFRQGGRFGDKTIQEAIREVLVAKRVGNRREVYVKSLESYLQRFATHLGGEREISSVTATEIETWLTQFTGYSRQTWLARLSTLFAFAVRRGFVERNPCALIDRVMVDRKSPQILSPTQARTLLAECPDNCKAYLILAMFAGIRPDGELMKMRWEHLNLETGTARVEFPKVRSHRRIVPLELAAVKMLRAKPTNKTTGPIAPSASTVRRFKRKCRALLGLKTWPTDLLRHTAASYLLALHKDAGKVAWMLGNSPRILLAHYHHPVTDSDCKAFWRLHER